DVFEVGRGALGCRGGRRRQHAAISPADPQRLAGAPPRRLLDTHSGRAVHVIERLPHSFERLLPGRLARLLFALDAADRFTKIGLGRLELGAAHLLLIKPEPVLHPRPPPPPHPPIHPPPPP